MADLAIQVNERCRRRQLAQGTGTRTDKHQHGKTITQVNIQLIVIRPFFFMDLECEFCKCNQYKLDQTTTVKGKIKRNKRNSSQTCEVLGRRKVDKSGYVDIHDLQI